MNPSGASDSSNQAEPDRTGIAKSETGPVGENRTSDQGGSDRATKDWWRMPWIALAIALAIGLLLILFVFSRAATDEDARNTGDSNALAENEAADTGITTDSEEGGQYDPPSLGAAFAAAYPQTTTLFEGRTVENSAAELVRVGDLTALISLVREEEVGALCGHLSVHYLDHSDGQIEVTGSWPNLGCGGRFGEPPSYAIRRDLGSAPVILIEGGGTWQGITCGWASLIQLAPQGARPIGESIPLSMDNQSGFGQNERFTGEIVRGTEPNTIIVQHRGTFHADVRYDMSGSGVTRVGIVPEIPSC